MQAPPQEYPQQQQQQQQPPPPQQQYQSQGQVGQHQQPDEVQEWVGRFSHVLAEPAKYTAPSSSAARPWHSDFFGCFDPVDSCLLTCCCPCVTFGKTHHRLRKNGDMTDFSPINTSCLGWYVSSFCGLHWAFQLLQRHEIKESHNLHGDLPVDCLKAWCLPCCDLIQQDKEAQYQLVNSSTVMSRQPDLKEGMVVSAVAQDPAVSS